MDETNRPRPLPRRQARGFKATGFEATGVKAAGFKATGLNRTLQRLHASMPQASTTRFKDRLQRLQASPRRGSVFFVFLEVLKIVRFQFIISPWSGHFGAARGRGHFCVVNGWSLGQPPSYSITLRTKMHTELGGVHGVHFREASQSPNCRSIA